MRGLDDEISQNKEAPLKQTSSYKLPTAALSPTQMGMYLRCPRMYEFRYIYGHVSPPGISLVMGKAIHEGIENIYKTKMETGDKPPIDETTAVFSDAWDKSIAEMAIEDRPPEDDEDAPFNTKDTGIKLLRVYNGSVADETIPIAIEQRVEGSVDGIPILGYIDIIKDTSGLSEDDCRCGGVGTCLLCTTKAASKAIVDTKVVKKAKTQGEVDNDMQLSTYARITGIKQVGFDALVKCSKPKVVQVTSTRTERDLSWYDEVVTGIAKGISSGYFPPCAPDSWSCNAKYCGYWSRCRGKKS